MRIYLFSSVSTICLALTGAAGLTAPQAMTQPAALQLIAHAPIAVHRDDNGRVRRHLRNQLESSNWSGNVVANFESASTYTAAEATWEVPTVTYTRPPAVCHTIHSGARGATFCRAPDPRWEYSSSWVGIGGFCEDANCASVDDSLIQLGTEQDASSNGQTQYYAWIETLPESEVELSPETYPVIPGDTITASLTCTANCTPGGTQTWMLTMTSSRGWTYSSSIAYASSLLSAEWIEEAPSSFSGVLPLANYGTATFQPSANSNPALDLTSTNEIVLVDPYGETSDPSEESGDQFATCWGNNPSTIAVCSAP